MCNNTQKKPHVGNEYLTMQQTHRMFVEHFTHCLLKAHGAQDTYWGPKDPDTEALVSAVLAHIGGIEQGRVAGAMQHTCQECCHCKQYFSDLQEVAAQLLNAPEDSVVTDDSIIGQAIPHVEVRFLLPFTAYTSSELTVNRVMHSLPKFLQALRDHRHLAMISMVQVCSIKLHHHQTSLVDGCEWQSWMGKPWAIMCVCFRMYCFLLKALCTTFQICSVK